MSGTELTPLQRAVEIQQERMKAIAAGVIDSSMGEVNGATVSRVRVGESDAYAARAMHMDLSIEEVQACVQLAQLTAQNYVEHCAHRDRAPSMDELVDNVSLTVLELGDILAGVQAEMAASV